MIVKQFFQALNQTLKPVSCIYAVHFTEMFCQQGNILSLLRSAARLSLRIDTLNKIFTETVRLPIQKAEHWLHN